MQFEANLPHQREAIAAIAGLFEGSRFTRPEERVLGGDVSANILKLPPEKWLENARNLAEQNGIRDPYSVDELDFTIEMETGTGKTYIYLRTMFELHRRYGLHKFMIVVPSVPIRQGVLATLRQTEQHFREIYATHCTVVEYDSKKLSEVRSYCVTNTLSVMVINKQAFDSDNKVIHDENRDDDNTKAMLRAVRPIIIMDEPQEGMDTSIMKRRFAEFDPLFKLRFSATHREQKNIIYRLTPYDAYNQGLVKKIAVLSIHEQDTHSSAPIVFTGIVLDRSGKQPPKGRKYRVRAI